jgi:hypothetical protein
VDTAFSTDTTFIGAKEFQFDRHSCLFIHTHVAIGRNTLYQGLKRIRPWWKWYATSPAGRGNGCGGRPKQSWCNYNLFGRASVFLTLTLTFSKNGMHNSNRRGNACEAAHEKRTQRHRQLSVTVWRIS